MLFAKTIAEGLGEDLGGLCCFGLFLAWAVGHVLMQIGKAAGEMIDGTASAVGSALASDTAKEIGRQVLNGAVDGTLDAARDSLTRGDP